MKTSMTSTFYVHFLKVNIRIWLIRKRDFSYLSLLQAAVLAAVVCYITRIFTYTAKRYSFPAQVALMNKKKRNKNKSQKNKCHNTHYLL